MKMEDNILLECPYCGNSYKKEAIERHLVDGNLFHCPGFECEEMLDIKCEDNKDCIFYTCKVCGEPTLEQGEQACQGCKNQFVN